MPAFTATAPGKIILFGEHAVVYGEAAIAAPVSCFQARTVVTPDLTGPPGKIHLEAADIGLSARLDELRIDHPLRAAICSVLGNNAIDQVPACRISITSTIPAASGLGSGAAVSACLIRAFSAFLGNRLSDEQVSLLTFEIEKIHHGTPSGIDNTVVSYKKPIYYRKGEPIKFLEIPAPISLLIAGSGKPGNTLKAVEGVRQAWMNDPEFYNLIFSSIGEISNKAYEIIQAGSMHELGPLMDQNQEHLETLGVSTPELDGLIKTARKAGALGAKLSGGGLGGHIIALIEDHGDQIIEELLAAGASSALITTLVTAE
jgi:mevalonate kinase